MPIALFLWGVAVLAFAFFRYESLIKRTERECREEIEVNDKQWVRVVTLLEDEAIEAENECRSLRAEINELKR